MMSKDAWFERYESALAEFYDRAGREPSVIEDHWLASRCYKHEWDIDWEKEVGDLLVEGPEPQDPDA
jgi:hypothetical protein